MFVFCTICFLYGHGTVYSFAWELREGGPKGRSFAIKNYSDIGGIQDLENMALINPIFNEINAECLQQLAHKPSRPVKYCLRRNEEEK